MILKDCLKIKDGASDEDDIEQSLKQMGKKKEENNVEPYQTGMDSERWVSKTGLTV